MIRTVVFITAQPGRREELLKAFRANVPLVRAEAGCIEYVGHVDVEGFGPFQTLAGPDTFVIVETWESADALKAHVGAPHMVSYAQRTKDLVAKRAIHVLSAID